MIKVEDIKEEINEVESVDDPLNIKQEKTSGGSQNIATEIKEEWIYHNSLCVQEMNNSEENNKVVDDIIDIVEHKIETDIYYFFLLSIISCLFSLLLIFNLFLTIHSFLS